jgi:hypothetical protein
MIQCIVDAVAPRDRVLGRHGRPLGAVPSDLLVLDRHDGLDLVVALVIV